MKKRNEPANSSRRKFLKGISISIVGAYVVPGVIKAEAPEISKEIVAAICLKFSLHKNIYLTYHCCR